MKLLTKNIVVTLTKFNLIKTIKSKGRVKLTINK
jgi:hypothetical protein